MNIGGLNYLPILIAAGVSFAFGAAWYGALARQWMAARDLTPAEVGQRAQAGPGVYVLTFVALLVMAWMLSGVFVHLARGGMPINIRTGAISGFLLWFGFVITTLAVNHAFQGARRALTVIDGGHWLGVLLLQGAVLGWWGVTS